MNNDELFAIKLCLVEMLGGSQEAKAKVDQTFDIHITSIDDICALGRIIRSLIDDPDRNENDALRRISESRLPPSALVKRKANPYAKLRIDKGMSQSQFALKTGISMRMLRKLEDGQTCFEDLPEGAQLRYIIQSMIMDCKTSKE